MTKATFDPTKPLDNGTLSASDMRNSLNSLYQGDVSALRPTAQGTPDLTVEVASSTPASYYKNYKNGSAPLEFGGGASPAIVAPTTNPRIDILTLNTDTDALEWITGTEDLSPIADWDSVSETQITICTVFCKPTMSQILDFSQKDTDTSQGYIESDCRPFLGGGSTSVVGSSTGGDLFDTGWITVSNNTSLTINNPFSSTKMPLVRASWLKLGTGSTAFVLYDALNSFYYGSSYYSLELCALSNGDISLCSDARLRGRGLTSNVSGTLHTTKGEVSGGFVRFVFQDEVEINS